MAIQIPSIQRNQVQQPTTVGRIETKPINVADPMGVQSTQAEHLLNRVDQFIFNEQQATAEMTATDLSTKFEQEMSQKVAKAKTFEGDPTEVYATLNSEEEALASSILAESPDSPLVRNALNKKLSDSRNRLAMHKITAEAAQKDRYYDTTADAANSLLHNDLPNTAQLVDSADQNSFIQYNNRLKQIRDNRIEQAKAKGLATPVKDKNGNIIDYALAPSMQVKLNKDLSDAIGNSIEVVSKSDPEKAQAIMSKYGGALDPKARLKLSETVDKDTADQRGLALGNKYSVDNPAYAVEQIMKEKDLKVREKALSVFHSNENIISAAKKAQGEKNFESLAKTMGAKKYYTTEQLRQDPQFRQQEKYLTAKQVETLDHMITQPEESRPYTMNAVVEGFATGKYDNMSYVEARQTFVGLSKSDLAWADKAYKDAVTQTPSEKKQMNQFMLGDLKNQAQAMGMVEKTDFDKWTPEAQVEFTKWNNEMRTAISQAPAGSMNTPEKQSKYVQEFLAKKAVGQKFEPFKKNNFDLVKYDKFMNSLKPMLPEGMSPAAAAKSEWLRRNPGKIPNTPESKREIFKIQQSFKINRSASE